MHYLAFNLTEDCRRMLIERFPPAFASVYYHHVTYLYGVDEKTPLPAKPQSVRATHFVSGEPGLELLIVEVDGSNKRLDGATYHLTLTTQDGVEPVDANRVLAENVWEALAEPIRLEVVPALND